MLSIKDRHVRFAIAAQASHDGDYSMNCQMTKVKQVMGTNAYYFSPHNPTGRYRLNLNKPIERNIAKNLIVINKRLNGLITSKVMTDKSRDGN